DGHQEEEDPPPAHDVDHQSADRRPEEEAAVEGHGHEAVGAPGRAFRHGFHREDAGGGGDHGRADTCHDAEHHEPHHARREAAEARARGHDREPATVDHVPSADVAETAEDDGEAD